MWRRPACQTLSKTLNIASAAVGVAPDLLKPLAILSDTTVRRSAVDRKDLDTFCKSEKRPHLSTILLFTSFFKGFTDHRKKTNRPVVFSCKPFPTFINKRPPMTPSNNMENETPSETYWRVQLVCIKVQTQSSLEPPLEHNQNQTPLMIQGLLWHF